MGGGFFSNFESSTDQFKTPKFLEKFIDDVSDKIMNIPSPGESIKKYWDQFTSSTFEEITGVDLGGNLTLRSIADAIVNLPKFILLTTMVFVKDLFEWLTHKIYVAMVTVDYAVNKFVFEFVIGNMIPEAVTFENYMDRDGDGFSPYEYNPSVIDNPVWMSWLLVKGVVAVLLWFAVIWYFNVILGFFIFTLPPPSLWTVP